jgi:hypothetical protein
MSTEARNRTHLGLSPVAVGRGAQDLLSLLFDAGMNTPGGTTQLLGKWLRDLSDREPVENLRSAGLHEQASRLLAHYQAPINEREQVFTEAHNRIVWAARGCELYPPPRTAELFGRVVGHSGRFATLWQRRPVCANPPDPNLPDIGLGFDMDLHLPDLDGVG